MLWACFGQQFYGSVGSRHAKACLPRRDSTSGHIALAMFTRRPARPISPPWLSRCGWHNHLCLWCELEGEEPAGEVHLIAGPPPANPPLLVAVILVVLGIAAPFLFLQAGSPSLLFGAAVLALAGAGIITMCAAAAAQLRRRADAAIRRRASISASGITLHPAAPAGAVRHFPADQIHSARLVPGALVIQTAKHHPAPGRHVLRFGKLATPRAALQAALDEFGPKP